MESRIAGLAIALLIAGAAPVYGSNVSTIGGTSTSTDASDTCRGAKFRADRDGTLLSADIDVFNSEGDALVWDVWESTNDQMGFDRLPAARRETTGTVGLGDYAWESSGPLGAALQADHYYVVVACWPTATVAYRYGALTQALLPVGQYTAGIEASWGLPDSNVSFNSSTSAHRMRLHTSAGQPLDVDAEFGKEGPFVQAFAGGAVYRADESAVLLGFRQQVRLEGDATLEWYVARCQGTSQLDCPDTASVWEPVDDGEVAAVADPLNPDPWIEVDDLQLELEPGWLYVVGLGWSDATSVGYHRVLDTDIHPTWGETLGFVSTTDPLPLGTSASFDWSPTFEMPQQLITAQDTADSEVPSASTGVSGFWKMGNIFEVDTPTQVEQMSFQLYTGYDGNVRMGLYEGDSVLGPFSLLWERSLEVEAGAGLAWAESGPVEVDIGPDPGTGAARHYLMAVGFEGNGVHGRETSPPDQSVSFGQRVHGWYSYTGSAAFPTTVSGDFVDRMYGWRIETCSVCIDGDGDGYDANEDCDDANPDASPNDFEVCDSVDNDCNGLVDEGFDGDGDGFTSCGGDCSDVDPTVSPNATETCDAEDEDCDGLIDEDFDLDGDGFMAASDAGCANIYDPLNLDCDDGLLDVFPGATELCDGVDNDCDGTVDEDVDEDADGFTGCDGDCDDSDFFVHPAALEICDGRDNDCTGSPGDGTSGTPDEVDGDADGWLDCVPDPFDLLAAGVVGGGDCDDAAAWRYPGAPEICDAGDDDCDGQADEDFDLDLDGFQDASLCPTLGTDCNDAAASVHPGAPELCNGIDDDCDGVFPTGADDEVDDDGDGLADCDGDCDDGDATVSPDQVEACDGLDNDCDASVDEDFDQDLDGYFARYLCAGGQDCDDTDPFVHPAAVELCDAEDNDCDGDIDEPYDDDGDGYVTGALGACEAAWGPAVDCDDFNPDVHPGATELCNGLDDDCQGGADEDFDADGDGWFDADGEGCADAWPLLDCDDDDPDAHPMNIEDCSNGIDDNCNGVADENTDDDGDLVTTCEGDCDDGDPTVNPDATEVCDGVDNDCDLTIDGAFDQDGDGFLDANFCGSLPDLLDCDDLDADVHPGNPELCDGEDQDCDGDIDEAFDLDGDGAFDGEDAACVQTWGDAVDCDDMDATVSPAAGEQCNGADDDCDGVADEGFDVDGDGVIADAPGCADVYGPNLDCDDEDAAVYPDATEVCDGEDQDCDGAVPEDDDGDGFWDVEFADCEARFDEDELDCDDEHPEVHPAAEEVCDDGIDNQCDGLVDAEDLDCEVAVGEPTPSVHHGNGLETPQIVGACGDCASDFSGGGFGLLSLLVLLRRRRSGT